MGCLFSWAETTSRVDERCHNLLKEQSSETTNSGNPASDVATSSNSENEGTVKDNSDDKFCGVCLDSMAEKTNDERKFGILSNCKHCYCHSCINKWRKKHKGISCPECRIFSSCAVPSETWVEDNDEKDKLTKEFKSKLSLIDCKYFKKGRGYCIMGNTCLYLHALSSDNKYDEGPRNYTGYTTDFEDEWASEFYYSEGEDNNGSDVENESDYYIDIAGLFDD